VTDPDTPPEAYVAAYLVKARSVFAFHVPWFGMAVVLTGCGSMIAVFQSVELDLLIGIALKLGGLALMTLLAARSMLDQSERAAVASLWSRFRVNSR